MYASLPILHGLFISNPVMKFFLMCCQLCCVLSLFFFFFFFPEHWWEIKHITPAKINSGKSSKSGFIVSLQMFNRAYGYLHPPPVLSCSLPTIPSQVKSLSQSLILSAPQWISIVQAERQRQYIVLGLDRDQWTLSYPQQGWKGDEGYLSRCSSNSSSLRSCAGVHRV